MICPECKGKTRVYETRDSLRRRECTLCGFRFRTQEMFDRAIGAPPGDRKISIQARGLTVLERRSLASRKECPVSREEMIEMMKRFPTLGAIARELGSSTTVLNRWLVEFDL